MGYVAEYCSDCNKKTLRKNAQCECQNSEDRITELKTENEWLRKGIKDIMEHQKFVAGSAANMSGVYNIAKKILEGE